MKRCTFSSLLLLAGLSLSFAQAPPRSRPEEAVLILLTDRGFSQEVYTVNEAKVLVLLRNQTLIPGVTFDIDRVAGNRLASPAADSGKPSAVAELELTPGEYRITARGRGWRPCVLRVLPKGQRPR